LKRTSRLHLPLETNELQITFRILRSSTVTLAGLVISILFTVSAFVIGLAGKAILPYDPEQISLSSVLSPPSPVHLMGTDSLGRDVLSRVLAAIPIDAGIAFAVVASAIVLGIITGTTAAYLGGVVEEVIMRITDIFLAFPAIILALAIAAALSPSTWNSFFALAPVWWPWYTRLARGQTLSIKSQEYVQASRASGQKARYIVLHHIVPNLMPVVLAYATLDLGSVILAFSVLSFLGLGAQPPTSEWGLMTVQSEQYLISAPWAPLAPGLAILIVAIGFSLLGDGLQRAFDPATRGLFS
jgi:peptide/nickel transport system permease protein